MKTVMIVDDDPDIRLSVKTILEKNKYKVIEAVNGNDCLDKLEKYGDAIDLILMDIMMPGPFIKDFVPGITNIKIYYLSSVVLSKEQLKELKKQKNVIGFIQKPFDLNDFLKKVRKAIGK